MCAAQNLLAGVKRVLLIKPSAGCPDDITRY